MLRRLFPIRQLYTTTRAMASKSTDPTSLHNPYFIKTGAKDIWSLINETAAQAQQESGEPIVNLGQGFSPTILLSLRLTLSRKH